MSSPLSIIDSLLQEFYETQTTNARKHEIEQQLASCRTSPEAWQTYLRAIVAFDVNQYVWFFCTSTLEYAITRRWSQLTPTDQSALRETLWDAYIKLDIWNVPRRQRETLAKLIVLIGKQQFPDEHPNYMTNCMELLRKQFPLGISLLRITSEEVVSLRGNLTADRKTYFYSCISMCIPDVMDLLTKFLLIVVCYINGKNNYVTNTDLNLQQSLPNNQHLSASVVELLTCVQHLVSWIPTQYISEYCLMSILDLSIWRPTFADISFTSLSVLNEMLYLQKPLHNAPTLIMGVNSLLLQHNATKQQNEIYMEKFRELLRLYTNKYHEKIMEENNLFDAYIKSLYFCTSSKNGALDFTEKLEIWTPIINGLTRQPQKFSRCNDVLQHLVVEIIERVQFEHNSNELELLDNDIIESNQYTEWQHFLNQCIECIALIAESRPNLVFMQVFAYWKHLFTLFSTLKDDIETNKLHEAMHKVREPYFQERIRDLSSISQTLARLATGLDLNTSNDSLNTLNIFMEQLLNLLTLLVSNKIQSLQEKPVCQNDLNLLYAQTLMSLRCILLLPAFPLSESLFHEIFSKLEIILLQEPPTCDNIVQTAASELLVSICTVLRPKFLLELPTIVHLMQAGNRLTQLPEKVVINIYTSLLGNLVLPWKNVPDRQQNYERRRILLQEYVNDLTQELFTLDINDEIKILATLPQLLTCLGRSLEFFRDVNNTSKDILTEVFKPIINKVMHIYEIHSKSNKLAIDIAEFSLRILQTVACQLGPHFIKEMIDFFICINSKDNLGQSTKHVVIEHILGMFQVVVEQPSSGFTPLLQNIMDYIIQHIIPYLQSDELEASSELPTLTLVLFDSVLINKWQYFYKSDLHVLHTINGNAAESSSENLHPQHFLAIMNWYGALICNGKDPNVVRCVLMSMQKVNDRWRLYKRVVFRDNLLHNFLQAIINLLISSEGSLHFDLLSSALFSLGQENQQRLQDAFIHAGFHINTHLNDMCLATDIPTFTQKLALIMQDAHISLLEKD